MYYTVVRRAAIASALALFALPSLAAEPLSLGDALRRAATSHPDLQAFNAELSGASASRALAGRSPTAEAGLLLEDALGTGDRAGVDGAQWTLSFTRALEIGGQLGGRLGVADAQSSALRASQLQRRRDVISEVTQRFIEAAVDRQRYELTVEEVNLAERTLESAKARVAAARAPIAERSRAEATLAQATLVREHAAHEELSARFALAISLGMSEPEFGDLQAKLFVLPNIRPLAELRQHLEQSPAAQTRMAEAAVFEAQRRSALASAGLKPTVTGGVRRYESGNDDVGFVVGVSMPLFAQRRAKDEADIASARYQQSEAENHSALRRAEEILFESYQELSHAREAIRLLDTQVLPAREEALRQTQYAYDRGRYGYQELSQVLQERAAAKRERIDMAARFHSLLAELERITGEPIAQGSNP